MRTFKLLTIFAGLALIAACSGDPKPAADSTTVEAQTSPARDEQAQSAEAAGDRGVRSAAAGPDAADSRTPGEIARAYMDASMKGDSATLMALHTEKARGGLQAIEESAASFMARAGQTPEDEKSDPADLTVETSFMEMPASALPAFEPDALDIGEAEIDGDRASVTATMKMAGMETANTLLMRRENGAWRIYASDTSFGGMTVSTDFEKLADNPEAFSELFAMDSESFMSDAFEEGMAEISVGDSPEQIAAEREMFEAVEPIAEGAYMAAWQIGGDYKASTRLDALHRLTAELGLMLDTGGQEARLAEPLQASLSGLSRPEAIERVCAEAGLVPKYPYTMEESPGMDPEAMKPFYEQFEALMADGEKGIRISGMQEMAEELAEQTELEAKTLRLVEGPRLYPVAFAGPFLVEVDSVTENVPYGSGEMQVKARAFGLDPTIAYLIGRDGEGSTIDTIVDERGRSMRDLPFADTFLGDSVGSVYEGFNYIELQNLLRDTTRIDRIEGQMRVVLPGKIAQATFAPVEAGAKQELGPLTVQILSTEVGIELQIEGPPDALSHAVPIVAADDAEGNPLAPEHESSAWREEGHGSMTMHLRYDPAPVKLHVKVIAEGRELAYPFELGPIPLVHFAEMPESIAELDFGQAEAPISAIFVSFGKAQFGQPGMTVQLVNHSNKDVMSAMADVVYLDEAGSPLGEDFAHLESPMPMPDFAGGDLSMDELAQLDPGQLRPAPLSKAGGTANVTTMVFDPIESAVGARITITQVDFADGTDWMADMF